MGPFDCQRFTAAIAETAPNAAAESATPHINAHVGSEIHPETNLHPCGEHESPMRLRCAAVREYADIG